MVAVGILLFIVASDGYNDDDNDGHNGFKFHGDIMTAPLSRVYSHKKKKAILISTLRQWASSVSPHRPNDSLGSRSMRWHLAT